MASGFYKKAIVEGKSFLVFSVIVALSTRLAAYFSPGMNPTRFNYTGGYLWNILAPFTENRFVSVLASALSVIAIAFLLSHINTKHILIRRKTFMPSAILLLLFSTHPLFMFMSANYIGIIGVLLTVSFMFSSYQNNTPQIVAVHLGFMLALCSLFVMHVFVYLPVFLIGFYTIRILDFRSLLAFSLGIFLIYFPVFTLYFFFDSVAVFLSPFIRLGEIEFGDLPLFAYSLRDWIAFGFGFLMLLVCFIDNYVNSFKDKIKIRDFLFFLSAFSVSAILFLLFVNISPVSNIFVLVSMVSILYAHLFSLNNSRGIQALFYLSMVFCLAGICVSFFS